MMRTAFLGTPELVVPCIELLHELTDLGIVITQPDAPAGRGRKLKAPPAKAAADRLGIPVWQPKTLRGAESDPRLQGYDLFVVFAYGEILRQPVLDLPTIDCINIHGSLLPRWRGASPLQASIHANDTETGLCIMSMVRALDAGPVYLSKSIPLDDESTLPWLHDELMQLAPIALREFIENHSSLTAVEQDPEQVTFCGKLAPADGAIDWQQSAPFIDRLVRAYVPMPGCSTVADGQRFRIGSVRLAASDLALQPGHIHAENGKLFVGTGDGVVEIVRLQAPGKRMMDAGDFLNGTNPPQRFD